MSDVHLFDVWKNEDKEIRKIVNLVHDGFYPDDPNDVGSFEEYRVYYIDNNNKEQCVQDFEFDIWIKDTNAKLIHQDGSKIGYNEF